MRKVAFILFLILMVPVMGWSGSLHYTVTDTWVNEVCETINKKEVCYLDIKNKNVHLKVWPCGKVEMETWKELNPNQEATTMTNPFYLHNNHLMKNYPGLNSFTLEGTIAR